MMHHRSSLLLTARRTLTPPSTIIRRYSTAVLQASAFSIPKRFSAEKHEELYRTVSSQNDGPDQPHYERLHMDSDSLDAGEDAFFISPLPRVDNSGGGGGVKVYSVETRAIGVFDGVGGWSQLGVDPREMSRAMMHAAKRVAAGVDGIDADVKEDPVKMLRAAYDTVVKSQKVTAGSTTACLMLVDSHGKLHAANLGDSGFAIVRRIPQSEIDRREANLQEEGEEEEEDYPAILYNVVYRSKEQQHSFNAPYQLGIIPEDMKEEALSSEPEEADRYNDISVQPGDFVILATDGVFDNLFDYQIASIVSIAEQNLGDAQDDRMLLYTARHICLASLSVGQSFSADTPFSRSARAASMNFSGGKHDDCTVVVARVLGTGERQPTKGE